MRINKSILKSILGSSFFKIATSLLTLLTVPMLLSILGKTNYGIWVTLTALIAWLSLFDFGSGYSLKNKVTESIVEKNQSLLHSLIAGTIQFYFLSTILIFLVFIICLYTVSALKENVKLSLIFYLPIILIFPFNVGNFILQGLKKFNLFNLLLFSQPLLWFITIVLVYYDVISISIYKIAGIYVLFFIFSKTLVFCLALNSVKFKWKELFKWKHFISSKASLLVGSRFFLLQLFSLIIYSIGNIMTYSNLEAAYVAQFDTVNKLFLIGVTFFNLIISVFWSEISHAKALKNKIKLSKIKKQLLLIALAFSIGTCIVFFFIPTVVSVWTKGMIIVELNQLFPFAFLVIIQYFAYSGAVFLNAFEDLDGQVLMAFISALIIIPLAKYFFYIEIGIGSVPLASALATLPSLVYVLLKSNKCINSITE